MPSLGGATAWLNSEPLDLGRAARTRRARGLLDADVHQLAAHGAVCPGVVAGLPGRRAGRHRRPHAGVLLRARHRPRAAGDEGARRSTTRSRSTTTTGSGPRSTTTTGRRSTSSTPTATSATAISAKDGTRNPSASSSDCSASSASSSPSRGSGWRRRPTGSTCARPRRISATGAASTSRRRAASRSTSAAYDLPDRLRLGPLGPGRRVDDRA